MIRILEEITNQSYRRSYKGALYSHSLTTVPLNPIMSIRLGFVVRLG